MACSSIIESFEQYSFLNENGRKILDDYYWLRFLELESPSETRTKGSISSKKMDKMGQSMFTVTKRLRKDDVDQFGFEESIIWTKPCIINRIVKDSPADQSHLEPGDFIIFVDKVNVVDMGKDEVLSLISKTDALTVEVFRRENVKMHSHAPPKSPILSTATNKTLVSIHLESSTSSSEVMKHKLASLPSTESRRKQLVTFSKDESITTTGSNDSQRSYKLLGNLIQSERQFVETLNYGYNRYIVALKNRKDLVSSKEHDILFKNIEGIKGLMENISNRDNPEQFIQAYKRNMSSFIYEYEHYFAILKTADGIVVDKTHHPEFIKFISNPPIPTNQPLFHNFLHKPLDYYNGLQMNLQMMLSQSRIDSQEFQDLNKIISSLQSTYRESMRKADEKKVDVKPLLHNLESRLVFAKCKPFKLDVPGRQWIFGGDLIRIEGNLEKPAYTLLFNDILLFATINRDRVLFITEEPIAIKAIVESFFNIRKKENEFRLTIETNPNYKDHSPTTHCTPDLIKSPLRQSSKRRNIYLRAPSEEIKKVWQNLITQQVFNINSISPNSINHVDSPNVNLLFKNPSTQTDIFSNASTNQKETENICSPYRRSYINAHSNSNQLNLKSQNAFDMGDSLDKIIGEEEDDHLKTPETPSCANLSSLLNDKIQKSLSSMTFSSVRNNNSDCGESCDGIFNDFGSGDLSFSNDVKECMFLQNDPFFADES